MFIAFVACKFTIVCFTLFISQNQFLLFSLYFSGFLLVHKDCQINNFCFLGMLQKKIIVLFVISFKIIIFATENITILFYGTNLCILLFLLLL